MGGTWFELHHISNLLESEHPRCGTGKSRGNGMASYRGQAEPRPLNLVCQLTGLLCRPHGLVLPQPLHWVLLW